MVTPNDEREAPAARPSIDPLAEPPNSQAPIESAAEPAAPAPADDMAAAGPGQAVPADGARAGAAPSEDRAIPATRRSLLPVSDIAATTCPFLVSGRGAWRGTKPSADHRCAAETPPGQPSRDHQRAHCLSERFVACPLYLGLTDRGAGGARVERPYGGPPGAGNGGRWGLRPTAPIVIEGPPSSLDPRVLVRSRRLGAIALIVLMVAAFALVALARVPGLLPGGSTAAGTQPPASATGAATGQPGGDATPASVTPTASAAGGTASPAAPEPTPAGSVQAATATPVVTPPASRPAASPSPQASAAARTYVVQRGDTLSSIARQFGTSVDAIAAANGITNPSLIGVGQVLVIP